MMRSNSSSFTSKSSRVGKAMSDSSRIGVPSCFSGGRRMVKCTRSTEGSDFRMLRQARSPACGSPDTSSTLKRSRTPFTTTAARLLASVSSSGPGWTSISSRSEEHTSELQSLMRISYAVFCLKKKKTKSKQTEYLQTRVRIQIMHERKTQRTQYQRDI